ncbi:endonuclease/exonuclease/phosphatase family protein [Nonomuraea sp. NPDC000554]|uniref:endonuclease/exonuclease/phosphatase family protein n=1 Tax=Nonomuraea sp. NPDC000554 TaxID=3154259 RepID=UPI00331DCE16
MRVRILVSGLVWLAVTPFAAWAVLRVGGFGDLWPWVPVAAYTPYAAAASLLVLVAAAALRRWAAGAVALAVAVALAAAVLPRGVSDGAVPPRGRELRVLAANLMVGSADLAELAALVTRLRPDVLTLQELTPEAAERLGEIRRALPHAVELPGPGASGSGVYSRYPLTAAEPITIRFTQARAVLTEPGGVRVEIVSVHPCPPKHRESLTCWRAGLDALPRGGGQPRVLAGDFNATLDHQPLRALLAAGYRDAGDATGQGFTATWPQPGYSRYPGVVIDHVLADARTAVTSYGVHPLAGTDHRPVFAVLRLS